LVPQPSRLETYLAKGKEDAKEEGGRLIQCLFQGIIQVNIQFPSVHLHILPDSIKQNTLEKNPDFIGFQVGNKDFGTGIRCVWGPFCRFGQCDELSPVR
jgi:hypothetical protein